MIINKRKIHHYYINPLFYLYPMNRCFIISLLLVCYCNLYSQNSIGIPQIDNFSNTEFHAGRQTWDIKQDKSGRMYFANNEGLLTYDGYYWRLYPQPNKSILRSIAIRDEKIFAGGQDEIGYYSPGPNGDLVYTSLKSLMPPAYKNFTDVWDIEIFQESIFFRSWNAIYEYKNQSIHAFPAAWGWQNMKLAGKQLIAQDKKGGLFKYVNDGWQPLHAVVPNTGFEITGIVPLNNDSLLVSSLRDGLFVLYNGVLTKKNTSADKQFIKDHIYSFDKINNHEFIVGTSSAGCLIMNDRGEVVQQIGREEGLQNKNVLSVFVDREHNIWAGLDNGISFIGYNAAIKFIKPDKPNELTGYAARVFDNKLYIATSDGVYMAPLSNEINKDISFSKSNFELVKNSGGQTWQLNEVNHQLLLGHNNGSFLIQNNVAQQLTSDAGIWLFVPTSSIFPAKIILGGSYAGLTIYEYANNSFAKNKALKGLYESLRFLAIDNNNQIWASHPYRGIYKIHMAPDYSSFTTKLYTAADGLPSTFRNYVFRIKNRVVFATEKGLYEYYAATGKFIPSPFLYNIFGNMVIQYINEDADGNLWFCSDKKIGVAIYQSDKKKYRVNYFSELTGKILSGFENINPVSAENILIAANDGIIHLNYKKYIENNQKLNVVLTQVKSFGNKDSVIFGGYHVQPDSAALQQRNATEPTISIKNNSLHFEFSSPSFGPKKNISYSYQLEGYDTKWSEESSKTEKDYTNLPNGSYVFKVKAFDNLGNESEVVTYSFIISPAWYNTIWAYNLYTLIAVVLFYLMSRWQKKKMAVQKKKYEDEQKRLIYIHQLEVEHNEKQIIELQNAQLVNDVIYKNKELAEASMHLVERSDALLKVKNELQQIYKKTGGNYDIKKAIQLVNNLEETNTDWEKFAQHFNEINNNFLKKLKTRFPNLTNTDLKICAYLQLKLSTKEIAQLMNLALRGVEISRYRLRKKLQLSPGESLVEFLHKINDQ